MKHWYKVTTLLTILVLSIVGTVSYSSSKDVHQWLIDSTGRISAFVRGFGNISVFRADQCTASDWICSGQYTPVITAGANLAASTTFPCTYIKIGSAVSVPGCRLNLDPTNGAPTETAFTMTIPIPTNCDSSDDAGGGGVRGSANNTPREPLRLLCDTGLGDEMSATFAADDASNQGTIVWFGYTIQ